MFPSQALYVSSLKLPAAFYLYLARRAHLHSFFSQYKERGALNKLLQLSEQEKRKGLLSLWLWMSVGLTCALD
jgi:hypothetical protein